MSNPFDQFDAPSSKGNPFDQFDEGDTPKKKAGFGTAVKKSLASAGNAIESAISLPAGALATYAGFPEQGDEIFRKMDANRAARDKWANPDNLETSLGQDIGATIATLPAQIPAMVGQAAEKGMDLIKRGEPLSRAIPATVADAALNAVGMGPMAPAKTFARRAAIGAAANVATGAGSDALTQLLATQEETKKAYNPYDARRRALDAAVGGITQGVMGERPAKKVSKVDSVRAAQKQKAPEAKAPEAPVVPEQMRLFDQFDERSPISPYQTEMAPDMWRVDENGIPIRADLSMEAQNLQQPLQRNLFGDELDANFPRDPNKPLDMATGDIPGVERFSNPVQFRNDPEGQIPLTEAIDNMPEGIRNRENGKFAPGTTRQSALDLLRGELPADPALEVGKMEADGPKIPLGSKSRKEAFIASQKSQRGVVAPDVFLKDFPEFVSSKIKDASGQLKALFRGVRGDYDGPERPMLGTLGEGIYLTESKTLANNYATGPESGRHVKQAYVDIKNPFEIEMGSPEHRGLLLGDKLSRKQFSDKLKASGFDGVIVKNGDEMKEVMAFAPEQVKNAFSTPSSRIPKSQRGGLLIDWSDQTKVDNSMALGDDTIPKSPDIEEVLAKAKAEGKDGRLWTYVQSGATSAAMKTGSAAIKAASEIVQNALKRSEWNNRQWVFPAEGALRKLSRQEMTDVATLMKDEMFSGQRYDGDILTENLTVKQLEAYTNMRNLFDKTMDAQNAARVAKGQKPITPQEAYLSSRWQGDFRRPVMDSEGKVVWYLAAKTKLGLEAETKSLLKMFPDLVIDKAKDHVVKSGQSTTDLQSMYSTMLDLLGRDDPAINKIKEAIEAQTIAEGSRTLAQEKHFQKKGNVHGFIGDRPWKNPGKEAVEMFQQQIQYAKNAFRWSEMQKAADDIKALVSDKELQQQQPNNVKYIREYFKNAIGMGEANVTRALNDSLRQGLGVSPQVIDNAVGGVKSFFITQKLIASAGYTAANLIQTSNVLPYLINLRGQGYKGNPATAVLVGVPAGIMMTASHYMKSIGGEYLSKLPDQFLKDAILYAEQNGVTARSVYDESPLESSLSRVKTAVGMVGKATMSAPETLVRSVAFMTYAQMLKDSGKFSDKTALFQKAEELVNASMVDYRETERPLMFSKMGSAGNFLNTLQTYPMSFYNQYSYMLGEASKGRPTGLMAMMALQYALAGAMGLPGFDDMDKLYKWIRDNVLPTDTWAKAMKSTFWSDPKLWLMETAGDSAVYGALSDTSGIGMTSRVSAPGAGAMLQSPAGPVLDIAKQIGSVGKAVASVDDGTKWAQAAMNVTPVGLQGLLETAPFMKGYTHEVDPETGRTVFFKTSDLADRKGAYERSPEEIAVRQWGVRSQKEVKTRDVAYATSSANLTLEKRSGELIDRIYSAARTGNTKRVQELSALYTELTGKAITETQIVNQIKEEMYTDVQRNQMNANTPQQLLNVGRMNKLLESK